MAKTRVHELAKTYGIESKEVLEKLKEMGEFVKSPSSTIELPVEMRFKKQYGEALLAAAKPAEKPRRSAGRQGREARRGTGTGRVRDRGTRRGPGRRGCSGRARGPQARPGQGAGRARAPSPCGPAVAEAAPPAAEAARRVGCRRSEGSGPEAGRPSRWDAASRQQPVRARTGHGPTARAGAGLHR